VLESAASVGSRIAARILGPSTWGNRNQSTEPFGATRLTTPVATAADSHLGVSEPEWARGSLATSSETPVYRVDGGVYYQTTFAYWRHRDRDLAVHPGQDIEHVVDDNEKSTRDRVDLPMRKSGLTTPHTTRRSWFELSRARCHRLGGTERIFIGNLPRPKEMAVTAFTSVGGK